MGGLLDLRKEWHHLLVLSQIRAIPAQGRAWA